MVLTCLPGGWTRISMPHSSGADLSSRMSEALPPPNISAKVLPKYSSMRANSRTKISVISVVMEATMVSSSDLACCTSSRWAVRYS